MIYLLMIYANEADWTTKTEAEMAPIMAEHERLERDLRSAGKYKGCGGLAPTSSATTLRIQSGKPIVTDGPFAETKEAFGGYYLVDAKDLDEALSFAGRIPGFGNRAVEIRPVLDFRT
ncbi:MAG: YciI family protein [Deltaproteobacteria bacterium]|nr:YciI family protein [Deltaproteobacteria bacterium]